MKRMTTKVLVLGIGWLLSMGASAGGAYVPDLVWTGAACDSAFNSTSLNWMTPTDSATALPFSAGKKLLISNGLPNKVDSIAGVRYVRNRRYLSLREDLSLGGLVFDSQFPYSLVTVTDAGGNGKTLSGDFQMVQQGPGVITLAGKGFTVNNTQGTLITNNSTLRVNGPGGSANTGNVIAETAFGPKVTFNNGHVLMGSGSNTTSTLLGYEKMKWDIDVMDNSYGALTFDKFCTWEGTLTGSANSTFNLNLRHVREVFGGNSSGFKGTFNVGPDHSSDYSSTTSFFTAQSGFSCFAFILTDTAGVAEFNTDGSLNRVLPLANYQTEMDTLKYSYATRYPLGMPDATINLKDSILMVWGSDLSTRSGETTLYRDNSICRIGALNGTAKTLLGSTRQGSSSTNHTWQIGSANTDAVFNGMIINSGFKSKSGLTNNIIKVGTGDWRLTYPNHTFNGKVWVRQGSLTVLGSMSTNNKLVVDSGAVLKGSPTFTALTSSEINGTLEIGGEPSTHGLGTAHFGAGDITVGPKGKIRIGLGQGGRCDKLRYAALTTFDPNSTIEFFVEEGPVAAGDSFTVLVPIANAAAASISSPANVVCQDGLVLDYTHLFDDPIWADETTKYLCGMVRVISNTNPGTYVSIPAQVTAVSPVAKSEIGRQGTITVTYDKDVVRGTGNITMGGLTFEPVITANQVKINFTGLPAELDSFDLVIPSGAILDGFNNALTNALTVRFAHDKVIPTLTAQTVEAGSVLSWEDGSMTFTFSEPVQVVNAAGFTINQTQFEKVVPSVAGSVLTVSRIAMNYATSYTMNVAAGALQDLAGNDVPAFSLAFSTAAVPDSLKESRLDTYAFNGKPTTTLPIVYSPIQSGSTAAYPLWSNVASGAGSFDAEAGELTWTSNSSNNKIMACFEGTSGRINVLARRSGTDKVGLKIQEAVAEAGISKWRTIKELTNDDLTETEKVFSFLLSPSIRFIKILPSTASATGSIILGGYVLEQGTAVKEANASAIRSYNVNGGLALDGLTSGARIEVYNLSGMKTWSGVATSNELTVPFQGFAIVKVTSEGNTTVIKALNR